MPAIVTILIATMIAGAAIPLGGSLATLEKFLPRWLETEFRHFVIALGGGILLAAVSLVLVPESLDLLPVWGMILALLAGGCAFALLDRHLSKHSTPAATLSDFLPEALAMGAAFANGESTGITLAVFMFLQNVPEGFNSYREMNESGSLSERHLLFLFVLLIPTGPIAGLLGYYLLGDVPMFVDGLMLFASGGILYLVFQDIAPQAKLENHCLPNLGAVTGFAVGLLGHLLTH